MFDINRSGKKEKKRQKRGSGTGLRKRRKRDDWPNNELGSRGSMRKSRRGNARRRKR